MRLLSLYSTSAGSRSDATPAGDCRAKATRHVYGPETGTCVREETHRRCSSDLPLMVRLGGRGFRVHSISTRWLLRVLRGVHTQSVLLPV